MLLDPAHNNGNISIWAIGERMTYATVDELPLSLTLYSDLLRFSAYRGKPIQFSKLLRLLNI